MADGPAFLVVDEEDRGQQLAGRHLGLGPALAVIVGVKDMSVVAYGHQALAGMGDAHEEASLGFRRHDRVDAVRGRGCLVGMYRGGGKQQTGESAKQRNGFT
ncbi:hypothetical protein FQZ97_1232670 [compost metagenome]